MASPRERILLALVIAAVAGAVGLLGGGFVYDWWTGLDEDTDSRRTAIASLQDQLSQKSWMQDRFKRIQADLSLPGTTSDQQAKLNREIDGLLRKAGLTNQAIDPQSSSDEDEFRVLKVQVRDVRGSPDNFGRFFDLVENQSAVLYIESIQFRNPVGTGRTVSDKRMTADFRIARLVDYATGEEPETNRRRRGRSRSR